MMSNSSSLYHFGIRGMKWGIRKYKNENLSNDELKRRINLYNAQSTYRKNNPRKNYKDIPYEELKRINYRDNLYSQYMNTKTSTKIKNNFKKNTKTFSKMMITGIIGGLSQRLIRKTIKQISKSSDNKIINKLFTSDLMNKSLSNISSIATEGISNLITNKIFGG